jgi:hypothetical protein
MSRIRSIHPGLWTDEAFVSLSPFARLLFLGIWNECDDMGSFEWSPLKLKMRVLPADGVDAAALLDELAVAQGVMRYEFGGKQYGAVRNFCQYQRPKKPNEVYPQTEEVRAWVNTAARSTRDGSEPVGNQLPTEGEKSRQMEDEGGRKETSSGKPEESKSRKRADATPKLVVPDWVPADAWQAFVEMRRAMPKIPFTLKAAKGIIDDLDGFRAAGHNIEAVLLKSVKLGYRGVFAPDRPESATPPAPAPMSEADRVAYLTKLRNAPHLRGNQTEAVLPSRNPTHGNRGAVAIGDLTSRIAGHAA